MAPTPRASVSAAGAGASGATSVFFRGDAVEADAACVHGQLVEPVRERQRCID